MQGPDDEQKESNVFPFVSKKHSLYFALLDLMPRERRELLAQFCGDCGADDPRCGCVAG